MRILLAILLLTTITLPIDRPYRHWAIFAVKCDDAGCATTKHLYDVQTPEIALKIHRKNHTDTDVQCIVRDYYFRGCTPWW